MRTISFCFTIMLELIIVITIIPSWLPAQSIWLSCNHDKAISLEILTPDFKGDDAITFTSAALFLSLRYPIAKKIILRAELPFAHFGLEADFGLGKSTFSDNTIGNPYIGLEIGKKKFPVFVELGVRAPLAEKENFATVCGISTDPVDRKEAFYRDIVSIIGMANYYHKIPSRFCARLRGGLAYWIDTNKENYYEIENDLFFLYAMQIGYESDKVNIRWGFSGRAYL